jgi:predicted DCC family thiol-disulfide oxidoreductase YuxK
MRSDAPTTREMKSAKPVMIYDGNCGFCALWIERWRLATGDRVEYMAASEAAARFPRLNQEDLDEAVHLVEPGGRVSRGAEAVFRGLAHGGGALRAGRALYGALPPFRAVSEAAYRFVAARRTAFSRLTRLLWGASPLPARIDGTARAVLGGLGLCYLAAFWSFGVQARGLIGAGGLLPAAQYLGAAAAQLGPERYWRVPTLAWLWSSDAALVGLCAAGALASLGLILDAAAGPCAFACWVLYLSIVSIGSQFMGYQWDVLLLETGLLALFLAPWRFGAARRSPSRGALWLLRLLLFKVMLQSGMVKLLSGDASWRNLTALTFHYWTQPLPTPLSWWADRLPLAAQKLCCALLFAVELGAPWLLLGPRRVRAAGAAAVASLMIVIALTGNYGFFNLLTAVLCLATLDDSWAPLARLAPRTARRDGSPLRARAVAVLASLWLAVSGAQWALQCGLTPRPARAWSALLAAVEPLRSINSYGLFAVMTTTRDEIAVEVSVDGHEWREWPFLWKPGDPRSVPAFVAPHMPRLDWQMWFAALGAPSPWMNNLIFRLLQGSPEVEGLLGPSPFPGAKPVYARASIWSARFATPEERSADGSWWKRERKGLAFPVVSLKAAP